jgi:hypothetical protein
MAVGNAALGVDYMVRKIAEQLETELDAIVEAMLERMSDEVPDFNVDGQSGLSEALRDSCYGNMRAVLAALRSDRETPSATPPEAVEEARVTARSGTSLNALLHTYRVGHAVVLERFIDLVEESELSAHARQGVLRIGSRYLFSYIDAMSGMVTQEFTRERDRLVRSSGQRRAQLVSDVLRGAWVGAADLAYDLDAEHLAVVIAGPEAEIDLSRLAEGLDRKLISVAGTGHTLWGWIGGRRPFSDPELSRLADFRASEGTTLGIGEPGSEIEGFRESHQQALAAFRVGKQLGRRACRYDDVVLEAIAIGNESAARRMVERELGPLLEPAERQATLRATLEAYLGVAMNASSAAAVLGVSDRTVANRIHQAEEILGRSVACRSAELSVALRLARFFS